MAVRKYITEIALNFYSDGLLLLHPKDIGNIEDQGAEVIRLASDCHIYLIVKRPRVMFVPGSIVVEDEKTSGRFRYIKNGVVAECEFYLAGKPNADSVEVSDYPHTKLLLIKDEKTIFDVPAHLCSMMCNFVGDKSIRDLEVVYVGMSYADGNRSAKDRLLSHSTLQQVLADLNSDAPDMEALIIMVQFASPQTMITFDGRDKSLKLEDDRDLMADLQKQQTDITDDLEIALIEASLIRYFQPPYNDKYKHRFPLPTHKILKEIYEIDFGALIVEINTENISARLFSTSRTPGYHHIGSVDLHDPTTRRSFFNLMNVANGSDALDHSGPIY